MAKREALANPIPIFGDAFEPVPIIASDRKNLLGNLSLSGERIAATLRRAATAATLASKFRKVSIVYDAKKGAKAAGSSQVAANQTSRKRAIFGEGDQEALRFGETHSEKSQWRKSSWEREGTGKGRGREGPQKM